ARRRGDDPLRTGGVGAHVRLHIGRSDPASSRQCAARMDGHARVDGLRRAVLDVVATAREESLSVDPYLWWVLAISLIVIGTIGTFVPGIPGPVLVFGGMLLAAWIDHFSRVGSITVTILAVLTAIAIAVEIAAGVLGARRVGASRLALLGAAAGTIVGLFFGFVGILICSFIGAVIGQLMTQPRLAPA